MVKCAECGYLTVRNVNTYSLDEAGGEFRETGAAYSLHERRPVCFQRCDLRREIKQAFGTGKNEMGCVLQVISKERDCNKFMDWQQGFTPKEHRELSDRKWMLEFQDKREKEDKEWREKQRRMDLDWREDQEKRTEGRHRWDLILTGGIATVAICAATIIAAFIARGK